MPDDPDPRPRVSAEDGAVGRAVLWLLGGLVAAPLLAVVVAPELLARPGQTGRLLALVTAAGLPGLLVIAAAVRRRRRIDAAAARLQAPRDGRHDGTEGT